MVCWTNWRSNRKQEVPVTGYWLSNLQHRTTFFWLFLAVFLWIPFSVSAEGWQIEKSTAESDTVGHDSGAKVTSFAKPVTAYSDDVTTARGLAAEFKQCPGLARAQIQKTMNGRGVMLLGNGSGIQCIIVVAHANNQQGFSLGFQKSDDDVGAVKLAEFMLFNRLAKNGGTAALLPARPNPNTGKSGIKGNPGAATQPMSLKAALDSIPRGNRPLAMAFRSEWNSVAMSMSYFPYVLFANNIAVEADCSAWNPGITPSVATMSQLAPGCTVVRYALRGNMIQFGGDDPVETGGFFGFKPDERINVNMSTQGGGSVGAVGAATSVLSGGQLQMSSAGRISVGSWAGTSTQGGNFIANSNSQRGVSGSYYLDGHLIAIQDQNGGISIGFIAGKIEGRDRYIFLNGKQYWN
jgi:hypothetical protein